MRVKEVSGATGNKGQAGERGPLESRGLLRIRRNKERDVGGLLFEGSFRNGALRNGPTESRRLRACMRVLDE